MAGTFGGLPEGGRMSDFLSLGGSRGGFRAGSSIASRARGGKEDARVF